MIRDDPVKREEVLRGDTDLRDGRDRLYEEIKEEESDSFETQMSHASSVLEEAEVLPVDFKLNSLS